MQGPSGFRGRLKIFSARAVVEPNSSVQHLKTKEASEPTGSGDNGLAVGGSIHASPAPQANPGFKESHWTIEMESSKLTDQSFYCSCRSSMPILGKTRKEVIKEFRTAELLEAARSVFARKGFHAATVEEIASAAGVAKGTVYLYYKSKQDVYWGALEHGITELHNEIQTQLSQEETPAKKVRAFIAIKIRYFEANRDFFKIYFSELGSGFSHPAQMPPRFEEMYIQQARLLEAVLQQGIQSGTIREVRADTAAVAISDLIRGIIVQRLLGWSTKDVESDVNFVFDLVWRGIAA